MLLSFKFKFEPIQFGLWKSVFFTYDLQFILNM